MQQGQRNRLTGLFIVITMIWLHSAQTLFAAGAEMDHFRELLEKGLSLHELEQELQRLEVKQEELHSQILESEKRSISYQQEWEQHQEQVGELLRSYYMGERLTWISVLLGLDNWQDMWEILERVRIIFQRDQALLNQAAHAWRELESEINELKWATDELSAIEQRLLLERDRIVMLQRDLDHSLDQEENRELAQTQIEQVRIEWETIGKPLLFSYFHALESAMQELPELIQGDESDSILRQEGLRFIFTLEDAVLNDYLIDKNDLFLHLSFLFEDDRMIAEGQKDDLRIWLSGQYVVRNEPENHLAFELDGLRYQGLSLPQTTIDAFNEEFMLGFYPRQLLPFIKVKDVNMNPGKLEVSLTFD